MQLLSEQDLPALESWLTPKQVLGFAISDTQIAIAAVDGSSWVAATDGHMALQLVHAIVAAGRKAWAWRGQKAAVALSNRLNIDINTLTWLRDATTAHGVVFPAVRFKTEKQMAYASAADPNLRPEPKNEGAARGAVAVAKLVHDLSSKADGPTRAQVLRSCEQEQLWRYRQQVGWPVDLDLLTREMTSAVASRQRYTDELGIDLTQVFTAREKAQAHAWLRRTGILITDKDGRPSLARDDYDNSSIPETPEAEQAWRTFRSVRSVASRMGKLIEVGRAETEGVLFATVNIRSTRTGRGTIERPALQNIHRDLRPLLVAAPGYALVSLDFSQVEPRIAAGLSQCPALVAALESGDFYETIARRVWGDDAFDENGVVLLDRRNKAKRLVIAIFYGLGAGAIAFEFQISYLEAKLLLDAMWNAFPGLYEYDQRLQEKVGQGEHLTTESGRPVPSPRRGAYAALNNLVQANASDIYYEAIARVAAVTGPKALYLGVHDELVLHVEESRAEWAAGVLNEHMPVVFRGVPIIGEAQILGRAWRK